MRGRIQRQRTSYEEQRAEVEESQVAVPLGVLGGLLDELAVDLVPHLRFLDARLHYAHQQRPPAALL